MRMVRTTLFSFSLAIALFSSSARGAGGGADLIHTSSAWCLYKGEISTLAHTIIYFKHTKYYIASGTLNAVTYWDIQSGVSARYGLSDHLELGLRQIVYQDNHKTASGFNLPDDLFLTARLAGFGPTSSHFRVGGLLRIRVPLAKYHNIVLEPYSAGRIELGAEVLLSFISNPSYPEEGFSLHFNIGMLNHNDVGKPLTEAQNDTLLAKISSRQLLFSLGCNMQFFPFRFALECTGNSLIQQPPMTAYSRETYLYLTPSVSYQANPWLTLTAGLDLRLKETTDKTDYSGSLSLAGHDFPNFPNWRLLFSAQALLRSSLNRPRTRFTSPRSNADISPANEHILDLLARERRETEIAEQELERIRQERERVARLLEKLRVLIEAKKKTPPPEDQPKPEKKPKS